MNYAGFVECGGRRAAADNFGLKAEDCHHTSGIPPSAEAYVTSGQAAELEAQTTDFGAAAMRALASFAANSAAGNRASALHSASEACHEAPDQPQPHYAYGEAWLAIDQPVRARQAFAAAVNLAPHWPDAWINLGIACYRQGSVEDAKFAMRQALHYAPGHPVAISNLGAFMRITGEFEGAEALLRDAIAQVPDAIGARLNLAADLLQEERASEALSVLDAAPALPEAPAARRHWHLQRVLALLHLGRAADAKAELTAILAIGQVPPELAPLLHWRLVLLAQAECDIPTARLQAEHMAEALVDMGPNAVPEHRIMAHFDLARFWSAQHEPPRAFANWQAGHDLLRQSQPFSRTAHRAFVDSNFARLDRARFTTGPRARNKDPVPVFIVGMPRSGTTLCEQILAAHAQVHGAGERASLSRIVTALGNHVGDPLGVHRIASLDIATLDRVASRYLADLRALAPDKARIVDKMPGNYLHLGVAGLLLPGARIIHCVRDPRDTGLSIFTCRFYGSHPYAHDLADLGWTIAEYIRLMAHWHACLPNPILTVALADWVNKFDTTLAQVLSHLDLPHDENCARFLDAQSRKRTGSPCSARQPLNARGLGHWRAYAAHLAPLIAELERAGAWSEWQDAPSTQRSNEKR